MDQPKTIKEAIYKLIQLMDLEVIEIMRSMPEENVIHFYKGFKLWIINNTGLLDENYELMAGCNAKDIDDASMKIFLALRAYLKDCDGKIGWIGYEDIN